MIIIPYQVDVPMQRWPIANLVILGLTVLVYILTVTSALPESVLESMILDGWNLSGWLGHVWLHADSIHLLGNMIFLWAFGNAVCAKVGNGWFPVIYLGLGLIAALVHVLLDGSLALGASGAINGVVGLFLIFYPFNRISCVYFLFIFIIIRLGHFQVSSIWMILLWLLFDLWGAMTGAGSVAYWAHLGGFAGGCVLGVLLLQLGLVQMERGEKSLLEIFGPGSMTRAAERPSSGEESEPSPARQPSPSQTAAKYCLPKPERDRWEPAPERGENSAPPRRRPDGFIRIQCVCGRVLKALSSLAGKRARCPACSGPVQVPPA